MDNNSWSIYGLRVNTPNSLYRYIGLTTSSLEYRLGGHLNRARNKKTPSPLHDWIYSVDGNVIIELIEACPINDLAHLHDREIQWISIYRSNQGSLSDRHTEDYMLNISDGGSSAYGNSPWNKGMVMPAEYREKLSIAHLGQNNRLGSAHSDETKALLSSSSVSNWKDPKYAAKTNAARNFKCQLASWKDKQRQSQMKSAHKKFHATKMNKACAFCTGHYPSY